MTVYDISSVTIIISVSRVYNCKGRVSAKQNRDFSYQATKQLG